MSLLKFESSDFYFLLRRKLTLFLRTFQQRNSLKVSRRVEGAGLLFFLSYPLQCISCTMSSLLSKMHMDTQQTTHKNAKRGFFFEKVKEELRRPLPLKEVREERIMCIYCVFILVTTPTPFWLQHHAHLWKEWKKAAILSTKVWQKHTHESLVTGYGGPSKLHSSLLNLSLGTARCDGKVVLKMWCKLYSVQCNWKTILIRRSKTSKM